MTLDEFETFWKNIRGKQPREYVPILEEMVPKLIQAARATDYMVNGVDDYRQFDDFPAFKKVKKQIDQVILDD